MGETVQETKSRELTELFQNHDHQLQEVRRLHQQREELGRGAQNRVKAMKKRIGNVF